jgi:hypothetical protein
LAVGPTARAGGLPDGSKAQTAERRRKVMIAQDGSDAWAPAKSRHDGLLIRTHWWDGLPALPTTISHFFHPLSGVLHSQALGEHRLVGDVGFEDVLINRGTSVSCSPSSIRP